ncbi:MAG: TraB/GumN family protein [Flavobacteriales bacterium]|nr:TraB/GumN family protein [Flavobacteriales bacterium]
MRIEPRNGLMALAMGLVLASSALAQQAPKYDALLWKITGPGLAKPSYLYGTMHVSNKVAFHLSEEFFAALDGSDVVALEMDPASWLGELATSEWFAAFAGMREGGLSENDLYRKAFELEFPDRKAYTTALAQDPEVVNDLLYRMTSRNANHEEDTYLDLFIYQCGSRSGKQVVGLEGMEHAIQQLMRAVMPDDNEPDPARQKRRKEARALGITPLEAIEDSYRLQDLDRMDSLFDLTSDDDRMRRFVIDERNDVFLEAMLPLMGQRSVFTGVGAMHLPGEKGLIEMLRRKGYVVEPVRGTPTSKSRASQRKHEVAYRPVQWRTQWAADSAFSIELPAPLYPMPFKSGSNEMQIAADMTNGSHFLVQRMPTFAALRGLSAAEVLQQVDSGLYEGVPGRIEQIKPFTTNTGWPGIDVRSTDRSGRLVHHKVVVSPFEVFIFERTMRDVSQAEKDGERAFASIRFNAPPTAASSTWSPSYGGCSMELPSLRQSSEAEPRMGWLTNASVEQIHMVQAVDADGKGYMSMSALFPDVTTLEQDTFELAVLAEQSGKKLGLTSISKRPFVGDARSIRATGVNAEGDTVHYMIALDGDRYDLLCTRAGADKASRFFDSYRRTSYAAVEPLITFRDTLMHFSVRTSSTHDQLMDRVAGFANYFQELLQSASKKENVSHQHEERKLLYRSTSTPEAVYVVFERFHHFITMDDEDGFWEERVKELSESGLLQVKDRRMTGEKEARRVELYLADSACSRTVRVVMQQCPGALYTLRTVADERGVPTAWADSFLVSFRTDTVFSEGIFRKKGAELLSWLNGADSTHAAQARSSFYQGNYEDADAPDLIAYIKSNEARDPEQGHRTVAIDKLGGLHHPQVIPFLREQYVAAGDSLDVRFAVLEALARQRTKEGAQVFLELMIADPPLSEEEWRLQSTFSPFFDSLEVARYLFPKAWELRTFPEFEDPVLKLAGALVDKKLMSSTEIAARKSELLMKGRVELKRAIASARHEGDDSEYAYDEEEDSPTGAMRDYAWSGHYERSTDDELLKYHEVPELGNWSSTYQAYQRLLFPFIKEPEVRAFFDQALTSGTDEIELPTAAFLLDRGAAVPPAFWERYAKRDDARLWTYRTLQALHHPELFSKDWLSTDANAKAYLLSGDREYLKDSVEQVGVQEVTTRFGDGPVHFFTSKVQKDEGAKEWTLSCTGFYREGDAKPFTDRFIMMDQENVTDRAELEKRVKDLAGKLRYMGRARWQEEGRFGYSSYLD